MITLKFQDLSNSPAEQIPLVNIAFLNSQGQQTGGVSADIAGIAKLTKQQIDSSDKILASAIGFQSRELKIDLNSFSDGETVNINLLKKTYEIPEAIIEGESSKGLLWGLLLLLLLLVGSK